MMTSVKQNGIIYGYDSAWNGRSDLLLLNLQRTVFQLNSDREQVQQYIYIYIRLKIKPNSVRIRF